MSESIGSKENILKCALELFSAKGYEAVSVQELVNMAGITKPTLYYYFGSKEGVYEQLLSIYYGMLDSVISDAAVYDPKPSSYFEDIYPVLIKLTIKYFEFAKAYETFYRMALANFFQPSSSQIYNIVKKYNFRQYEIIGNMFGHISSIHKNMLHKEKLLSWTYIGIVNSFIGLYYNEVTSLDLGEETAKQLVRQFMHGIHS